MRSIVLLVSLIIIFVFIVPFIQTYIVKYLNYLDSKKDYSDFNFKIVKEKSYLYIEYLVWEDKKLFEIKRRYSDVIAYNNISYSVVKMQENIGFPKKLHFNKRVIFEITQ